MIKIQSTTNFYINKSFVISLFMLLITNYLFSQNQSFELITKFLEQPKFNANCGIVVSAEEIKLLSKNDSLKFYIICSERYRYTKIDLNTEYGFKIIKCKYTDLNSKIIGIKSDDVEFYLIDSFVEIKK